MIRSSAITTVVLAFACWAHGAALSPPARASSVSNSLLLARSYRQRVWTREHGLPSNTVRALGQTKDGHLWIGTAAGLVRFDGAKLTTFNRLNAPEFSKDNCTALAEDVLALVAAGLRRVQRRIGHEPEHPDSVDTSKPRRKQPAHLQRR